MKNLGLGVQASVVTGKLRRGRKDSTRRDPRFGHKTADLHTVTILKAFLFYSLQINTLSVGSIQRAYFPKNPTMCSDCALLGPAGG